MQRIAWGSAAYTAMAYAVNAVYQGYIVKFYQQRGVRGGALTALLVSFPAMSVFAQPLWGRLADRTGRRRGVLRTAILLSACALPLLRLPLPFAGLLAVSCAFAACYPAIQPLSDSVILDGLHRRDQPYGPVRLAGCAAFAAASFAAGRLLRDRYAAVPAVVCPGLIGLAAATALLPREAKEKPAGAASFIDVLRLPHMLPLLALFMLLQMTLGYFYSSYALFFTGLPGADSGLLGLSLFVATASEAPFLLLGDRLFRRYGAGRLLLCAAFSQAVRFLILGLSRRVPVILASQLLHGLGFAVISFSMAQYVSRIAPPALRARGQTLLSAAGLGVARVLGVLMGRGIGGQGGFLAMAGAAALGLIVFFPVFHRLPPLNGA